MMGTLLPPEDPRAPGYWPNETSGVLKRVMLRYLDGAALDKHEVAVMRGYLYQWVIAPVWGPSEALEDLRMRVAEISTQAEVEAAITLAVDLGMDPL